MLWKNKDMEALMAWAPELEKMDRDQILKHYSKSYLKLKQELLDRLNEQEKLREESKSIKQEAAELKQEAAELKQEGASLKQENKELQENYTKLVQQYNQLEQEVAQAIRRQQTRQ